MSKLVYQEPQDHYVQVSVCSLNSFLLFNPLRVEVTDEKRQKIGTILENSKDSDFILMPEYTYTPDLEELYQQFCNDYKSIIIAGSGLEQSGGDFYAYAPVFIPDTTPMKVYKKFVTDMEKVSGEGRIVNYPGEVQRRIAVQRGDSEMVFSVYVCNDFLMENKSERSDVVFVPQYEPSPQQFMNEADRIAKGMRCFVLGANNANNNQRSIGCAILNSSLISGISGRNWRLPHYNDDGGQPLGLHHTIVYDIQGERIIKLKLNIGCPYSLPYSFNLVGQGPVIVPRGDVAIS
jgi:hypothetical protein